MTIVREFIGSDGGLIRVEEPPLPFPTIDHVGCGVEVWEDDKGSVWWSADMLTAHRLTHETYHRLVEAVHADAELRASGHLTLPTAHTQLLRDTSELLRRTTP